MAIYHLHAQTIGRGQGKSAVAAAAYRSTSRITDNETGIICDYTQKEKALITGIVTPENIPEWAKDRDKLWNSVQEKENRKNSQFAWEYDLAIPTEYKNICIVRGETIYKRNESLGENLIRQFCEANFISKGLICDYAIHAPSKEGDQRNCHAHVMVTTREITSEGWGEKYRHGENKQSDRINWLKEIRESWENICNKELERLGSHERIDCRTLEAQGIDRIPQRHQGHIATAIERKGKTPDRTKIQEQKQEITGWTNEKEQELNQAKEIVRLANLSDQEFEKEAGTITQGNLKAQALATKENILEIEKENSLEKSRLNNEYKVLLEQKKKTFPEKSQSSISVLVLGYKSTDGKKFSEYQEYEKHQKSLENSHNAKVDIYKDNQVKHEEERKLISEIKKDGSSQGVESINRLLNLSRVQREKRPTIYEKIKEKAQEIFERAVEFTGFRTLKNAYDEVREARAETERRKEQEQQQEREQERQRQQQRNKDQGWSR